MEIEWLLFRYTRAICVVVTSSPEFQALIDHLTVHFIRRRKQHERLIAGNASALEDIEGAHDIRLKVTSRVRDRARDCDLSCKLIYLGRVLAGPLYRRCIPHITDCDPKPSRPPRRLPQQFQIVLNAATREIVEHVHACISLQQQVARKIRADKSCATEDQYRSPWRMLAVHLLVPLMPKHSYALRPKVCNSATMRSALSSALCSLSQSTSSATPSSNCTLGAYPSSSRALEMSPKQWRTSPARYLPVISQKICNPMARESADATSRIEIGVPAPMLIAWPSACGDSMASRFALTAS